ncbi:MAG: hypothetical protein IKN99_01745 [Bacteroidales bacterium]|nr:hypothetical protein [Bacteroidales bacterium]
MKFSRRFLYTVLLFVAVLVTPFREIKSQNSEIGACVGTMFYLGDLNQTKLFKLNLKDKSLNQLHIAGGFMYRYNISPRFAFKADFLFGKVSSSDVGTDMANRNFNFFSPITEFSAEIELNFFELYNTTGKNRFSPYIFAGITLFSFNPQTSYNDEIYELHSLGTEGQGLEGGPKPYSLTSAAIPFGIGIKATIGRYFAIGAEWGMRWTFTDYLDDVGGRYYDNDALRANYGNLVADLADRSPEILDVEGNPLPRHVEGHARGNETTNDAYSFACITLTVKFGNEDRACRLKLPRRKH